MNLNLLYKILKYNQKDLRKYLRKRLIHIYGESNVIMTDGYVYAIGEIPILLVAHTDTVHTTEPKDIFYDKEKATLWSPQGIGGDDRCGIFIILALLESGFRPSVVFTADEEIGALGAMGFAGSYYNSANFNFIIEFDRRGANDAVFYNCDNKEFVTYIETFGFKEAWGTFSDICSIAPNLGIAAVNLSCGFYLEHTKSEYINIKDVLTTYIRATAILSKDEWPIFKYINKIYRYDDSKYKTNNYEVYTHPYEDYEYDYGYNWVDEMDKNWYNGLSEEEKKLFNEDFSL